MEFLDESQIVKNRVKPFKIEDVREFILSIGVVAQAIEFLPIPDMHGRHDLDIYPMNRLKATDIQI